MKRKFEIFSGAALVVTLGVIAYPAASDFIAAKFPSKGERSVTSQAVPTSMLSLLQSGLKNFGAQIADTMEKSTVARKEMDQASVNYDGVRQTAQMAAIADEKSASPEVLESVCDVAEGQTSAMEAKVSSDMWAKAITKTNLERGLAGPSEAASTKIVLDDHYTKYCDGKDQLQGRCNPTGDGMQNADLDVSTAMQPNLAQTLSEEEYAASNSMARNIVNAVPVENVPPGIEKSERGRTYLLEKRANEATLSLAHNTFAKIIARRRSREDAQK
jgi:hypothetical protein